MQGLQATILHERNDSDRVTVLPTMPDHDTKLMINRSQFVSAGINRTHAELTLPEHLY